MSNASPEQIQREQQFWGRQSIVWAINLRSIDTGHGERDESWIDISIKEAHAIADEYWVESVRETQGKADQTLITYARKIQDWCATHRRWTPPAS
jgi:hypothetical protein